jgi:hypothetical protein
MSKHRRREILKYWSNDEPCSAFSARWRIPFFQTSIGDPPMNEDLAAVVRARMPEVMSLPAGSDGNTGLGSQSMTSRFQMYNLLAWEEPAIGQLRDEVYQAYLAFLEAMEEDRRRVYIQCWANLMNPGQFLRRHVHSVSSTAFVSGNYAVVDSDSQTIYNYIYNDAYTLPFGTTAGSLVLFPSYIPHYTTRHPGPGLRISIGFDVVLPEGRKPNRTYLLFDDPDGSRDEKHND